MSRTLTIGTFDIPHIGHKLFLEKALAVAGGKPYDLNIGINADRFVTEFKGEAPLYNQFEREAFIRSLGYTQVSSNTGKGIDLIRRIRPELLVVGSDWLVRGGYLDQVGLTETEMSKLNLNIVFVPYSYGYSTSDIKARIRSREGNDDA